MITTYTVDTPFRRSSGRRPRSVVAERNRTARRSGARSDSEKRRWRAETDTGVRCSVPPGGRLRLCRCPSFPPPRSGCCWVGRSAATLSGTAAAQADSAAGLRLRRNVLGRICAGGDLPRPVHRRLVGVRVLPVDRPCGRGCPGDRRGELPAERARLPVGRRRLRGRDEQSRGHRRSDGRQRAAWSTTCSPLRCRSSSAAANIGSAVPFVAQHKVLFAIGRHRRYSPRSTCGGCGKRARRSRFPTYAFIVGMVAMLGVGPGPDLRPRRRPASGIGGVRDHRRADAPRRDRLRLPCSRGPSRRVAPH